MPAKGDLKRLVKRAGGKWAISWQSYAVSAPISTLAITGAAGRFADSEFKLLAVIAVAITTTLSIGLFLLLMHKTIFRNRSEKPVPLAAIIGSGLVASGIFTAGIEVAKFSIGVDPLPNLWGQVLANAVLISWWGITTSLVLDDRERFGKQRDATIFSAIELEEVTLRGSETEERLRKALNKKISNEISEARSALNAAFDSAKNAPIDTTWSPIADLLRDIATDVMRPLSKKLWDSAGAMFPRPNLFKVLSTIINSQPLRPFLMTILVVFLSAETLANLFGWQIGTIVLVATVAFVWLSMPAANIVIRKNPTRHALIFWMTVISFQIFDTLVWIWAAEQSGATVSVGTLAINVLACFILVVLTSGVGAFGVVNQKTLDGFRSELNQRELSTLAKNRVVSALALEASRNLHGRVQTRLLSCAGAIDRAVATGDIELLNKALVEVNEIFDAAALFNETDESLNLKQKLTQVAEPWVGLCEINLKIAPSLDDLSQKNVSGISDVVEEAITNAVRHGKATQIEITVQDLGLSVLVTASDNGVFVSGGAPGVGTELIHLVSQGDFGITGNPRGGADLRVSVAKAG